MFVRNGKVYTIDKLSNEVDEYYYLRGWFVAWMEPSNIDEYRESVKLSRMLVNYRSMKCVYSDKVMELFRRFGTAVS